VLNRQSWITQEHKSTVTRNSNEILKFHKQFITSFDSNYLMDNDDWSSIAMAFIDQVHVYIITWVAANKLTQSNDTRLTNSHFTSITVICTQKHGP
jgi:hypothetical protein